MSARAGMSAEAVARHIHLIRGHKVMFDSDLASLYGVATRVLNQAVKRNRDRFPPDFMFQISAAEATALRSQSVTSNTGRGGRRSVPYAFTEHGAIMAATVLNSSSAIRMSIYVVRAFVQVREMLSMKAEIIAAMRRMMTPVAPARRGIGVTADVK